MSSPDPPADRPGPGEVGGSAPHARPGATRPVVSRLADGARRGRERVRKFGPGLITGAAGDDPAGVETCTAVGATTGFSMLWLMLLSTPMMIAIQNMAARLAIITGRSLPEIITAAYSRRLAVAIVSLLALANVLTIGADLQGMAEILAIVTGLPSGPFLVGVTALVGYLVTFGRYRSIKRVLIALGSVLTAYVVSAVLARPDYGELLKATLIPHLEHSTAYVVAALGLLGTTMSPYLLFWQAAEEREEHKTVEQAKEAAWDTSIGMVYSSLVEYSIIVASALMLFGTAAPLETVRDAALALRPLGSDLSFVLFTVGILASGFLAIPVLAGSTAYAVADTFGWREGLDHKVSDARGFYLVFFGSLLVGDLIHWSPISAVDALYYSQVFDGVLLPVLVGLLLLLNSKPEVVGEYRNGRFNRSFGWLTLLVSLGFALVLFAGSLGAHLG